MLTCKQITELVTDYAEGQLGLMARLRFWMHISMCSNCKTYVRQLKATAKALGKLPEPRIPQEMQDELMRRFDGWTARR
jgi:anti-sigma factor RsiW